MPDDKKKKYPANTPQMRASTPKERIGDFFSELMGSVAEQPLVRGLSKANELLNPAPPPGFKIGMMPGQPGSALGKALAPDVKMMHPSVPPEFHAVERAVPYTRPDNLDEALIGWSNNLPKPNPSNLDEGLSKIDRLRPGNSDYLSATKHRVNMDSPMSGKMEFLDPDVAEFMSPGLPDLATREGQEKLRVLKYLTGKR